jgi:protoheme IX farnesyltransferase
MSLVEDTSLTRTVSVADPSDFLALLKPKVMTLVVLTALTGLLLAPAPVNPVIGFAAILAIAVGAGAAGALNMWYDSDIDGLMTRTRTRPVPAGRVSRQEALSFGLVLAALSVFTLGIVTNWLAAALLAFTIFFYLVVYTMGLKRRTPQNIVIGGAAGALPPIIGYAAATGHVALAPLVLFALIFVWTPPHFWALALVKAPEFGRVGLPMMPNVRGAAHTRLEILLYSLVLAPLGVVPYALGFASPVYGELAAALGAVFLAFAVQIWRKGEAPGADRRAIKLFLFSILYLYLLFAEIAVERVVALVLRLVA